MEILGLDITWLNHDCFKINADKIIYFDPYQIGPNEPADIIFITHEHYDHCSVENLVKIVTEQTVIVASQQCKNVLQDIDAKEIIYMKVGDRKTVEGIEVEAVPAYNVNKQFHPKADGKLRYVVNISSKRIYHAGDTDFIPEMRQLKDIDIALLPVSGTYVMTAEEAALAAEVIRPKVAVPMHYGAIVGSVRDAERFKRLVKCEVVVMEKS